MSGRFYPLIVANPASPHIGELDKFFDDEHATLTKVKDLISYTSVTEPSPWPLIGSAVKLTKEGKNYREEWDKAADRGTAVHDICQNLALFGKLADYNTWLAAFDEELRGYAEAAYGFFTTYKPKVLKAEFVVCDLQVEVAGRADLYAKIYDPVQKKTLRVLTDYKTVDSPEKITRFPRAYLDNCREVVARAFAMRKMGQQVDECWIVRFAPNGIHHVRPITQEEEDGLFQSFLRARWEWEFRTKERWA